MQKRIGTTQEARRGEDDHVTGEIIEQGMSREEIIERFPPNASWKAKGKEYDRAEIIKACIQEEFDLVGKARDPGDVRTFWYSNLQILFTKILGEPDSLSLQVAIQNAWKAVIESGDVTYEGMNITSGKEAYRRSRIELSPNSNIIISAEKDADFPNLKWLADLFRCTLVTNSGEPSRAVWHRLALELVADEFDFSRTIHIIAMGDFDPQGDIFIPETYVHHLKTKLRLLGIEPKIKLNKVVIAIKQVSKQFIDAFGAIYNVPAGGQSKKQALTIFNRWLEKMTPELRESLIATKGKKSVYYKIEAEKIKLRDRIHYILVAMLDEVDQPRIIQALCYDEIERMHPQIRDDLYDELKDDIDEAEADHLEGITGAKGRLEEEAENRCDKIDEDAGEEQEKLTARRGIIRTVLMAVRDSRLARLYKAFPSDQRHDIAILDRKLAGLCKQIGALEYRVRKIEKLKKDFEADLRISERLIDADINSLREDLSKKLQDEKEKIDEKAEQRKQDVTDEEEEIREALEGLEFEQSKTFDPIRRELRINIRRDAKLEHLPRSVIPITNLPELPEDVLEMAAEGRNSEILEEIDWPRDVLATLRIRTGEHLIEKVEVPDVEEVELEDYTLELDEIMERWDED